jgi:hypothetical protein
MFHFWLFASPLRQRRVRGGGASLLLVLLLLLALLGMSGCAQSTTVPSNGQIVKVVQHLAQLKVAPGQTVAATVTCDPGETLVSGGYYTTQNVPGLAAVIRDSYPSDGSGTAPSLQGQAETAWTVRATNPTATQMVYEISATCLKGIPIKTGVWFASYVQQDPTYNDSFVSLACTDSHESVLTGGGFQSTLNGLVNPQWGVVHAYPSEEKGVAHKLWHLGVFGASGAIYAVCAQGVFAEPLISAQDFSSQLTKDISVTCPEDAVLVGGGFVQPGGKGAGEAVTIDTTGIPDLTAWHAGYNSDGSTNLEVDGICVQAQSTFNLSITFSNYRHLLRIPADRVLVATDGSGQVNASQSTAHVTQEQSGPIAAQQTINPFTGGIAYVVPAGCGDATPAIAAATNALKAQLTSHVPAGQLPFGSPSLTINRGSLTCSPGAGTQQRAPFSYLQAIDGSATQATYNPDDVRAFQRGQLEQAVRDLGGQYVLDYALICPEGTQVATATATRASILCPAGGVVEWHWTADALKALARSLAGKHKDEAQRLLDATPGVEPGTSTLAAPSNGTTTVPQPGDMLPSDPNSILIEVIPLYEPSLLLGN